MRRLPGQQAVPLVFLCIGAGILLFSVLPDLWDALRMRARVPVPFILPGELAKGNYHAPVVLLFPLIPKVIHPARIGVVRVKARLARS
jgi:hypothetical protein